MTAPSHAGANGAVSVGTAAVSIVAGKTLRRSVFIQNLSSNKVYIGFTASVTTANGLEIASKDSIEFADYNGPLWGIADGAASDVRVGEVGGN